MSHQATDQGHFPTPNASRYLQQLCKHFAHKVEARCDPVSGHIALASGPVTLAATDDRLVATIVAEDEPGLHRSRRVLESHLERFAFREGFTAMIWTDGAARDTPASDGAA